ncbi:ATP-binding protein [bacterium]|nr:ATP-binding protein [bacterium]
MPVSEFFLEVSSTSENLAMIRSKIRAYTKSFKVPLAVIDEVELSVDEAVTNVLEHAYSDQAKGLIQIRAWKKSDSLTVTIRDFGAGYKPRPVSCRDIRRILEGYTRKGMGRFIMKECMDSVRYKSIPRKYNETILVKKIKRGR